MTTPDNQPTLTATQILEALIASLQRVAFLDRIRNQYHIVVLADDNSLRVESYASLMDTVAALRTFALQPSPPSVVPFVGMPMAITRPPNRQLRTPEGLIPLEVQPEYNEEDDLDWDLSNSPQPRTSPIPEPAPIVEENLDDEPPDEEDEESSEGLDDLFDDEADELPDDDS